MAAKMKLGRFLLAWCRRKLGANRVLEVRTGISVKLPVEETHNRGWRRQIVADPNCSLHCGTEVTKLPSLPRAVSKRAILL